MSPLSFRYELARKAIHLLSAVVPVAYMRGVMAPAPLTALLAVVTLLAFSVESLRSRSGVIRTRISGAAGVILREHEHERWAGATWLALAFTLAVAAFPRSVAVAAMWAVSVGDAGAAIVGRVAGRLRQVPGKTLEGSAACFILTLLGARYLARLPLDECVVGALAAAVAERAPLGLDDNLRVCVATGGGILLWRLAFS